MDMNFDCIIGIDPGSNGGLAILRPNQNVQTIRMPKDLKELKGYFDYINSICKRPIIFLEKVQLRHDDVGSPGKAFRIQQLLASFQKLKDIIEFANIPYCLVHPISWQSYLKLVKKNEEKKERKNRYKSAAEYYYPEIKATLWNADAVLIMHFGRLKRQNEPDWISKNLPSDVKDSIFG